MKTKSFRARHLQLMPERVHDPYKLRRKPLSTIVCPQCQVGFHKGRWQWQHVVEQDHEMLCPACRRIKEHLPAGFVRLQGGFFDKHRDEILSLVRNREGREKAQHPMARIMAIEHNTDHVLVTTTDIHLARAIGEAVHQAYQGTLDFHYNKAEYLLRMIWMRD